MAEQGGRPALTVPGTIAAATRRDQRAGLGPGRALLRAGGPTVSIPVSIARRAAELRRQRAAAARQQQDRLRQPIQLRMPLRDRWGQERETGAVLSLGDLPPTFTDWILEHRLDDACWQPFAADHLTERAAVAENHARLDRAQAHGA